MTVEEKRPPVVDTERFECRAAAKQRFVARSEDRLHRIDEASPGNSDRK
jgi:hypothetical protein